MSGWAPFATRRDGPPAKHGYQGLAEPSRKEGAVYHSAEGGWTALMGVLDDPNRRASFTFSNPKHGALRQHYPVGFHTWANGSMIANMKFVSCENEGVADEPLTVSQVGNLVQLTIWLRDTQGWTGVRRGIELWEHREMTRFGAASTACPSGRIPWQEIIGRAEEDKDMLWLIKRKPPSQQTYVTNGIVKTRVDDPVALGKLRTAGIWPGGSSMVLDDDAIDQIPDA